MASLRKLNRRLLRWERYAARTGHLSPRARWSDSRRWLVGHCRAFDAVEAENERRFWDETPEIWLGGPEGEAALIADVGLRCFDCGLPDLYRGDGDGIGSCECPRCSNCGAPPEGCDCSWDRDICDCCGEPDDDAGHGDDWPGVETTTAFQKAGLL